MIGLFKSIQWKIITIFLLLTVSVMMVVGTFLLQNISAYYHNDFTQTMENQIFTEDLMNELSKATNADDAVAAMTALLNIYSIRMGIDSFRNFYVLDAETGAPLSGSAEAAPLDISPNVLLAMAGRRGQEIDRSAKYMDFAQPIMQGDAVQYIVYVKDTKEEVYDITSNIFINIMWALLFGLILSAFLGFFLSRTLIAPLATLQYRAESMAEGDFGHKVEVRSRDEIGRLTVAFNDMASQLDRNLADIEAEKNKFETILVQMTDGVIAFDSGGNIIHMNPAAQSFLGDCKGKQFQELFAELDVPISLSRILYLESSQAVEREVDLGDKILKASFVPFNLERRAGMAGVMVVFQDITRQLKLDRSRREFVANVSHELRTPLTTIKSYAETILDLEAENPDAAGTCEFVRVIETEADRMTRIVKDLLTLSKLDTKKQTLNKEMFDLDALVESVVEKLKFSAKDRAHEMTFLQRSEIKNFYGDRDKIEQVLTNILTNAIKYTPNGGHITAECSGDLTTAMIRVRDDGIGIPRDDLPHIFERFYRVDKARSRESGGTGLGLAIAKEIVEAHGGTITIESPHKKGTIVTILLPMYRQ